MTTQQKFDEMASKMRGLTKTPSNEEKLKLYGLYKQAMTGDNNTACPGMLQFEAKAKWEAWNQCKGISKDDAMKQYSEYATTILAKYPA